MSGHTSTPESGLSTAQYLLTSSKSCVACGVAVCVYIRARVIALRALFTAHCVVLLRRTGSALPLQTRRAPSGLRSSRHALHMLNMVVRYNTVY